MAGAIQKLLIGVSVIAGTSAIATSPAFAATFSVSGTDYLKYEAVDTNGDGLFDATQENSGADLNDILQGSCTVVANACSPAGSPGGNVELGASIDRGAYSNLNAFRNAPVTSLTGVFDDGKSIVLSSLSGLDWFTTVDGGYDTSYGATNLATKWFNDAIAATGILSQVPYSAAQAYNIFLGAQGFQRFSDPNISYVNQKADGSVAIGLAGFSDAGDGFPGNPLLSSLFRGSQVSEVVKSVYDGETKYLYSFNAANSGLTEIGDGRSHTGNFEVDPSPVQSTPEPSAILGLIGVGGLFAAKRKLQKA